MISNLVNLFLDHGAFTRLPALISIERSLDFPPTLLSGCEQTGRFDTDSVLGAYHSGEHGRRSHILIHERAIRLCAEECKLNKSHLFHVVLIHELAHWLTHRFAHSGVTGIIDNSQPELNHWFSAADSTLKEALAQLLTSWVAEPSTGFHATFSKLLQWQSSDYRSHEQVLKRTTDRKRVLDSLLELRKRKVPANFADWLTTL